MIAKQTAKKLRNKYPKSNYVSATLDVTIMGNSKPITSYVIMCNLYTYKSDISFQDVYNKVTVHYRTALRYISKNQKGIKDV